MKEHPLSSNFKCKINSTENQESFEYSGRPLETIIDGEKSSEHRHSETGEISKDMKAIESADISFLSNMKSDSSALPMNPISVTMADSMDRIGHGDRDRVNETVQDKDLVCKGDTSLTSDIMAETPTPRNRRKCSFPTFRRKASNLCPVTKTENNVSVMFSDGVNTCEHDSRCGDKNIPMDIARHYGKDHLDIKDEDGEKNCEESKANNIKFPITYRFNKKDSNRGVKRKADCNDTHQHNDASLFEDNTSNSNSTSSLAEQPNDISEEYRCEIKLETEKNCEINTNLSESSSQETYGNQSHSALFSKPQNSPEFIIMGKCKANKVPIAESLHASTREDSSSSSQSYQNNIYENTEKISDDNTDSKKKARFPCSICTKTFSQKGYLNGHLRQHSRQTLFTCHICVKSFRESEKLEEHLKLHSAVNQFSCETCSKIFSKKSCLRRHQRTHTGEKPYICEFCSDAFVQRSHLNRHLMTHNSISSYNCMECSHVFSDSTEFTEHMKTHDSSQPLLYGCDKCSLAFQTHHELEKHHATHNVVKKLYVCELCSKNFTAKENLVRHLETHGEDDPYECNFCSKTFDERSDLDIHLKIHISDNPFTCPVCSQSFSTKKILSEHLKTHPDYKPYTCPICQKGFTKKSNLPRHVRTHTGETPFVCGLCSKGFNQKQNLKKHFRTIHSLKESEFADVYPK